MIIDELRARAALTEDGDLLREAAARIEVCLDAIELAANSLEPDLILKHVRAARYALLAARPEP